MADRVLNNGLILTDWADNMAQQQANAYAQVKRQRESQDYERAQAVDAASNAARQQYAAGDMSGARQTAAAGNAWDVWGKIDEGQKAQVAAQANDIGTAAYNLSRLPKGQQRQDYFNSFVPTLKSHGMSDAEIQQYSHGGFLDNDDALAGYRDKAIGIKEMYDTEQARIKMEYDRESDMMKPVTASDGAVLTRGADGGYQTIYTPGTKPETQIVRNEDGSSSVVRIDGTPGQSYGTGGGLAASTPTNKQAVDYFVGRGWSPEQAAGIVNNLHYESAGMNHQAVGDGGKAYGLAQWHPDRQAQFAKVMGKDIRNSTPAEQMQFVDWELRNTEQAAGQRLRNATSANEATGVVMQHYERPASMSSLAARQGRTGGQAAQSGAGVHVQNLGGGRSGPEWVDENTQDESGRTIRGQRNRKTGEFKIIGGGVNKAAKPPTQEESLAAGYANRMSDANNVMQDLYNNGYKAQSASADRQNRISKIPLVGNYLAGEQTQQQQQAELNFLTALLRKESGASISPTEFQTGERNYFPRPGDSPAVLMRKSQARQTAIAGIRAAGGSATGGRTNQQTRVVNGRTYVKVQGGWKAQ